MTAGTPSYKMEGRKDMEMSTTFDSPTLPTHDFIYTVHRDRDCTCGEGDDCEECPLSTRFGVLVHVIHGEIPGVYSRAPEDCYPDEPAEWDEMGYVEYQHEYEEDGEEYRTIPNVVLTKDEKRALYRRVVDHAEDRGIWG